jgi:pimeloyl-ACP methyl ester carboxylesterase
MKKVTQYKNISLVYHVYGSGSAVILLHGFAETNTIWRKQIDSLSNYCMLVIPDVPGSGESALFNKAADKNLTIDDLAASVHSVIKNENVGQCIMLGHSMGGYITLSYAEKYPERLKAFGFVQSTAFADSDEKKQNRKRGIEMMEAYGSYAFLKTTTPNLFADSFKKMHANEVEELIEQGGQFKKENLQQYYYAMMERPDRTDVLKNSKLPVLFAIGTKDVAAPLNEVLKQVHQPEISYIHIIENIGHMSMLEAPDKLNEILKNFVNATK